jgi:hypothetical protein
MIDPGIITGLVGTVGKSSLVDTLRDEAVDFLADKAKGFAGDEITGRIEALRSDAKLNRQIQKALERAAQRWAEDSPDDELVGAVAKSTTFFDLAPVQKAVREIAGNPFNNTMAQTVRGAFKEVLPVRFEEERIERGIQEFTDILREEFVSIPALQPTIQTFASLNTATATAVLPHMEELLDQLLKGPTATEEIILPGSSTGIVTWTQRVLCRQPDRCRSFWMRSMSPYRQRWRNRSAASIAGCMKKK